LIEIREGSNYFNLASSGIKKKESEKKISPMNRIFILTAIKTSYG